MVETFLKRMNPGSLKEFHPQRILIINPFGIGDVLFTTPLICNLKYHFPESFIGYVANQRTAAFLVDYPKVNQVFVYERDEFNRLYRTSKQQFMKKGLRFLQEIKQAQFDLVIDLSLNGTMSFLMGLIGIPRRIGFNYKNRSFFLTTKIKLDGYEKKHVVDYYLSLLEELGCEVKFRELEFPLKDGDRQWVQEFWKKNGILTGDLVVGLVPGGGASWGKDAVYKRWAPEKYAKLADKIVEKFSAKIILLGDQKETELCRQVKTLMRSSAYLVCGETSVGQFAALLKNCRLNVVNDGGPLHAAVAVGATTVSIFGPVDDLVYGPVRHDNHLVVKKDLACRPCYRRFRMARCSHISCLGTIGVEEVFEKVEIFLGERLL